MHKDGLLVFTISPIEEDSHEETSEFQRLLPFD